MSQIEVIMEYIDILNENGVKTGEILSRDETHRRGEWHRSVIAVIVDENNKVLMQQRSELKQKFPGLWDLSMAGHIRSGEYALESLNRELNEEVGYMMRRNMQIRECRFISSFKNIHHYIEKDGTSIDEKSFYELFVIFVESKDFNIIFNDKEVQDIKWMSYFEVKKLQQENKLHPRTEWVEEVFEYLKNLY